MAAAQVLVTVCALLMLASGQLSNNGFINPLFLPRGLRGGRYLDTDPYGVSINPYSSNPYAVNPYSSNLYLRQQDLDYRRGLIDPRFEDARRYQSAYGLGLDRFYSDGVGLGTSRRLLPEELRYLQLLRGQQGSGLGLATTAQPLLDRGHLLDRNQLLDQGQLLDRERLLDRLDRGQLSTTSPQLSVTVTPNSST